jgi:hypothetical protein
VGLVVGLVVGLAVGICTCTNDESNALSGLLVLFSGDGLCSGALKARHQN